MISVLTPTYGRCLKAMRMRDSAHDTADGDIETLFYVDNSDPEVEHYREGLPGVIVGSPIPVGCSWNVLAWISRGDFLMMGNDDLIFKTKGWDTKIKEAAVAFQDEIVCLHCDEGIFGEKHAAFPIITRKWFRIAGFTPPHFMFYFNDTWIMEIAKNIDRLVYVPDVLIDHMHCDHGKDVKDATANRHRGESPPDKIIFDGLTGERKRLSDALAQEIA